MQLIEFFSEDTDFKLKDKQRIINWLSQVTTNYEHEILQLNYIYCSDNYLLEINQTYLNHDYFTDIITFDQRDFDNTTIEGDIFISIDRVKENSATQSTSFEKELHRVMAHGLLHLLGLQDKTDEQKQLMRKSEDACLSLLDN